MLHDPAIIIGVVVGLTAILFLAAALMYRRVMAYGEIDKVKQLSAFHASERTGRILRSIHDKSADIAVFNIASAVIGTYESSMDGNSKHSRALGADLPCNFGVYAECVKTFLETVAADVTAGRVQRARVYTFFERTIFEWYNPFIRVVRDQQGAHRVTSYSEGWWEQYKEHVVQYKQGTDNLVVIRLIAHPRRPISLQGAHSDIEINKFTDAERYIVKIDDTGRAQSTTAQDVQRISRDVPGYELISLINDDNESYSDDLRERAMIHCIMRRQDGEALDRPIPGGWRKMVDHFHNTYHTRAYRSPANRTDHGCFWAYASTTELPWAEYADAFVVELEYDRPNENQERSAFGIALQKDGFNDAEGIVFLDAAKSRTFIEQFDQELKKTNPQFQIAKPPKVGSAKPQSSRVTKPSELS